MTRDGAGTLVVGCGYALLTALQGQVPDASVIVVEDPRLVAQQRGGLREEAANLPVVSRLMAAEYVDRLDPQALVRMLPGAADIDRVVPATDEVSAVASAVIAAELGLPGSTARAATVLRDKIRLRETAAAAGLRNPRWRQVRDPGELAAAVRDLGAGEVVLKPATRSGSRGVLLLDRDDDLDAAWRVTSAAATEGLGAGAAPMRYLVEERVHGPEVSVECLVAAREVVFCNVTAKTVAPGRHPVELGHVLPAPVPPVVEKDLLGCMEALVDATGFEFGVLHGEWILGAEGPVLVECAGRIPGDEICRLMSLAYGIEFIPRYTDLMSGDPRFADDARTWTAGRAAAVAFLTPAPGVVSQVCGVDDAMAAPGVAAVQVTSAPGARVNELRASADRAGFVVAVGADAVEASRRAADAAARIVIGTTP